MREKQQKTRSRAVAALAAAGCLAGWLALPALATPALAAPALARHPLAGHPSSVPAIATPALMVAGSPVGIAADPTTHTFWIAQGGNGAPTDFLSKIGEVTHGGPTLDVPTGVTAVAADPAHGMIWTIGNNASTHTVSYLSESNNVVHSVTLSVTSNLTSVTVDPVTEKVIVLDAIGDVITIDETHPTDPPVTLVTGSQNGAEAVAVDPAGSGTIWVGNGTTSTVSGFRESDGHSVGTPASAGANPSALAVDTTTKTVWAADSGGTTVSEFAEATPGTVHTIHLPGTPLAIAADPVKGQVWVASGTGAVYEVSEAGRVFVGAVSVFSGSAAIGLAADPGTGQVWVIATPASQGSFTNVVPLVPRVPVISSPILTWFATNDTSKQSFTVTARAFPAPTFTMTGAPSWLKLDKITGILSGKPPATGVVKLTLTATNSLGVAHQAFTLNIGADPVFTSKATTTFAFGVKGTFKVKATGVPAPVFTGFGLPPGLTLSSTGLLSGTLPKGTKSPVPILIEAANKLAMVFQIFSLKLAPGVRPKFVTASTVTFRHGRFVSFTIRATGFPTPTLKVFGTLPPGLKISIKTNGTAVLFGIPARSDAGHTYRIKIIASNGVGLPVSQILTIKIT